MPSPLEDKLQHYPHPYITDTELELLLGDSSSDSRHGKVKRLLAQEKLLRIRRGLYCLTQKLSYSTKLHPFELASHIYGPSYISLESALAYHKLIPEAVPTTTSACLKRSKEFQTPLGIFSYLHLPPENFYTAVELVADEHYHFFVAKPWKAIGDYVFCYKKEWEGIEPLVKSLRIEPEDLPSLTEGEVEELQDYYQQRRLNRFFQGIQRDLRK